VRLRYLAAACAAIGLLVSACGGSSSSGSSGSGSASVAKQITIWTTNADFWTYQSSHLAPFTKATGIKVTVNAIPEAGILDKETIAQRAKSGAFAMYEGPTSLISQDVGLLGGVPLKPLVANKKLAVSGFNLNDMSELGNCSLNGTLYCLPQFVDGAILAYNKKLLKQAGISTPPTTWPQILADANAVTQKTGTPGFCTRGSEAGAAIATFHFGEAYYIPYSTSNKGFMVGPKWNSLLDSPGALKWATLYQQLMTKDAPKGVGAYTAVVCVRHGISVYAALPLALLAGWLAGAAVERVFFRPIERQHFKGLLVSVGVTAAAQSVFFVAFGANTYTVPDLTHNAVVRVGGIADNFSRCLVLTQAQEDSVPHAAGPRPGGEGGFRDQFRFDPMNGAFQVLAGDHQVARRSNAQAVQPIP